jgi:hypothetical protein
MFGPCVHDIVYPLISCLSTFQRVEDSRYDDTILKMASRIGAAVTIIYKGEVPRLSLFHYWMSRHLQHYIPLFLLNLIPVFYVTSASASNSMHSTICAFATGLPFIERGCNQKAVNTEILLSLQCVGQELNTWFIAWQDYWRPNGRGGYM